MIIINNWWIISYSLSYGRFPFFEIFSSDPFTGKPEVTDWQDDQLMTTLFFCIFHRFGVIRILTQFSFQTVICELTLNWKHPNFITLLVFYLCSIHILVSLFENTKNEWELELELELDSVLAFERPYLREKKCLIKSSDFRINLIVRLVEGRNWRWWLVSLIWEPTTQFPTPVSHRP